MWMKGLSVNFKYKFIIIIINIIIKLIAGLLLKSNIKCQKANIVNKYSCSVSRKIGS